jgi:hypothetical protein
MEILKQEYKILNWLVNPDYFETFDKASSEAGTSYHWDTAPANTAGFIYTLYFRAKDDRTGTLFADYNGQLVMNVRIQDEKQDAQEMLTIVKELHLSVNDYIKENIAPHQHKLYLHDYEINEHELARMEAGMLRLRDKRPMMNKPTNRNLFAGILKR